MARLQKTQAAGEAQMNSRERQTKLWRALCALLHVGFEKRFNFAHDRHRLEKPALIVANHVTNYDPILLGISFPYKQIYFVASEHLFRKGLLTRLLRYVFSPIARRKGSNGMDTAMACMRTLRDGYSVCIFGEGETTWDGLSQNIIASTGSLARVCNAPLITYRLEGGYLTAPRWGKGIRRGRMQGRIVNEYTPEQLRAMSPEEITAAINRDIYEDAWQRQEAEPVRYRGRNRARQIEVALFMCPKCRRIGSVYGEGNRVKCSCGLDLHYTEYGAFEPAEPFRNMAEWNAWQHAQLKSGDYDHSDAAFDTENVSLMEIESDHQEKLLAAGTLQLKNNTLHLGEYRFALGDIFNMALVQRRLLVFTHNGKYHELRAEKPCCMRKYLAMWNNINESIALQK